MGNVGRPIDLDQTQNEQQMVLCDRGPIREIGKFEPKFITNYFVYRSVL